MTATDPLQARLFAALAARRPLIESGITNAFRIANGTADALPGLIVEQLGSALIVQFHEGRLDITPERIRPAIEALMEDLGVQAAYQKFFVKDRSRLTPEQAAAHTNPEPWIGRPVEARIPIFEHGAQFLVRPYDGYSYGLFLEQRDNRAAIRRLAAGARVLNLFSYTCGFSVAAALGSAAEVTSVDLSKRFLEWGRSNFALNNVESVRHFVYPSDTFDFCNRARRQGRRYDMIVVDPPTFSRLRRPARTFVLEKQIGPLLESALALLDPGGHLFFSTNNRAMNHGRLDRELHRAAAGRRVRIIDRPRLPLDFAGDPDYSHAFLARVDA